jgi:hypothetical protein
MVIKSESKKRRPTRTRHAEDVPPESLRTPTPSLATSSPASRPTAPAGLPPIVAYDLNAGFVPAPVTGTPPPESLTARRTVRPAPSALRAYRPQRGGRAAKSFHSSRSRRGRIACRDGGPEGRPPPRRPSSGRFSEAVYAVPVRLSSIASITRIWRKRWISVSTPPIRTT